MMIWFPVTCCYCCRGFTTNLVRLFVRQLLECVQVLEDAKIIHCDLKPENILLVQYVFFFVVIDPRDVIVVVQFKRETIVVLFCFSSCRRMSPQIKVIDFGSACFEKKTVYPYIQSRFYRSPEVIIGLPYTSRIDLWSIGCICAELFLGARMNHYCEFQGVLMLMGVCCLCYGCLRSSALPWPI